MARQKRWGAAWHASAALWPFAEENFATALAALGVHVYFSRSRLLRGGGSTPAALPWALKLTHILIFFC